MKTYTKNDKLLIELGFRKEFESIPENLMREAWMIYTKVGSKYTILRGFRGNEDDIHCRDEEAFNRRLGIELERESEFDSLRWSAADQAVSATFKRLFADSPPPSGLSKSEYAFYVADLKDKAAIEVYAPDKPPFDTARSILQKSLDAVQSQRVRHVYKVIVPDVDENLAIDYLGGAFSKEGSFQDIVHDD